MLSKRLVTDKPFEALPTPSTSLPERTDFSKPDPTAVLDARALAQLRELDPTGRNRLVERVLATFEKSAARLGPQLADARRTGDLATVRLVAHTFKSSAGSIGALTLAQRCARVEAAIVADSGDDLTPDLDAMTQALGVTLRAIAQHLGSSQPAGSALHPEASS